ncbi:hypothetical protein [Coralloluteibacterium stylophorae]|uniref:Uncharacterized protein n=1 Tax=Coralloluteibacterium stylophorae TaxID=1776034 RepID=A0AAP2C8R5_9GAMM|nr:hypothetical protein [Coralloluteibacterium stylophorae]MBS7456373.1 hypothetical protein [Coralloluteibacterium stylophorae]
MRDVGFSLGTLALAVVLTVVANLHPPQPAAPAADAATGKSSQALCADGGAACATTGRAVAGLR